MKVKTTHTLHLQPSAAVLRLVISNASLHPDQADQDKRVLLIAS